MSWSQDYWDALSEAEQVGVPAPPPVVVKLSPHDGRLPFDKFKRADERYRAKLNAERRARRK